MKRNKLFLLGLFVVFAAVLSLSLVSSTFAKYVTTESGSDKARVAKWGVVIEADALTVFKDEYDGTVKGTSSEKVVAPGTAGSLANLGITGTPEVKVEVKYTATLTLTGWTVDGADYCPLEITVGTTTYKIGTNPTDAVDIDDLISKVEAAIAAYTKEYGVNTDLSSADAPEVSWAWAFTGNDNAKDTKLGDVAAAGSAPIIKLDITCTVTQID